MLSLVNAIKQFNIVKLELCWTGGLIWRSNSKGRACITKLTPFRNMQEARTLQLDFQVRSLRQYRVTYIPLMRQITVGLPLISPVRVSFSALDQLTFVFHSLFQTRHATGCKPNRSILTIWRMYKIVRDNCHLVQIHKTSGNSHTAVQTEKMLCGKMQQGSPAKIFI
jgi:hypothetical protein